MAKVLAAKDRRVSASVMKDVLNFVPQDGFKLEDGILGKIYTVTGVKETEFGGNKSFTVTLESDDEKVINLSASAWKRARVLGKTDVKVGKPYGQTKNVFLRSNADDLWNSSTYFHSTGDTMKKDEDFTLPAKVKITHAILSESEANQPNMVPFLYKGYRKVVDAYQKRNEFPTFDDFKAELLKTEDRIAGLPAEITTPTPHDWVKEGDVSNYRHTLILSDITM